MKGLYDSLNDTTFYLAAPFNNEMIGKEIEEDIFKGRIPLQEYQVTVNPTYSRTDSLFCIQNFWSADDYPPSSTVISPEITDDTDAAKLNAQFKEKSPINVEVYPLYYKPNDAYAVSIHKNWDMFSNTCRVRGITVGFQLDTVALGNLIKLELPFKEVQNTTTGEMVNLAEGGYIIDSVNYSWKGEGFYTTFDMYQVRF